MAVAWAKAQRRLSETYVEAYETWTWWHDAILPEQNRTAAVRYYVLS